MGSKRKKREKNKDFVKTRLKVGKEKPKATSYTDLGFKAKSIGLPSQSLTKSHTTRETFNHHLSLARHHSHATRKEAIGFLQSHLPDDIDSSILTTIAPLILDSNEDVRSATLSLLRSIPLHSLGPHVYLITLYIHSGMTHISSEIRADSSKFLLVLLGGTGAATCDQESEDIAMQIVTRSWTKTIECFGSLLGWTADEKSNGSALRVTFANLDSISNVKGHIDCLSKFLRLGLEESKQQAEWESMLLLHPDSLKHLLPRSTSVPFARLGLFSTNRRSNTDNSKSSSTLSAEDIGARFQILKPHLSRIRAVLDMGRKEGGDLGRSCKQLSDFLETKQVGILDKQ
ncbi:Rix1 complex component [Dipodascopsis uninucleata]